MIKTLNALLEATALSENAIEHIISLFISLGWKKPLTGKRMENKIAELNALLGNEKAMHASTATGLAAEFVERKRLEKLINARHKALMAGESYGAMMARESKEHFEKNPPLLEEK